MVNYVRVRVCCDSLCMCGVGRWLSKLETVAVGGFIITVDEDIACLSNIK